MTWIRLIIASLVQHAKIHFAVLLGVAAATAVLTGALLVGDSMRGSLRHLTLDRLGRIDELLLADHFFRQELADELTKQDEFKAAGYRDVVPAILLPNTSLENPSAQDARAFGVFTIGCNDSFAKLSDQLDPAIPKLQANQIVLNAPLAKKLQAKVGHKLTLRFPSADQVPADSPLAHKDNRTRSLVELEVVAIIPAEGLGRFSLHPQQVYPFNAFVSLATLQAELNEEKRINTLLVSSADATKESSETASQALNAALNPSLADYGLKIERVKKTHKAATDAKEETIFDYYSLTSDRMLLDPEVVSLAKDAFAKYKPEPIFTYLANRIERVPNTPAEKEEQEKRGPISYSTISALELSPNHWLNVDSLQDNEILLTSWAAEDQKAKVGDRIRISYFEPETTHGNSKESRAEFIVRGIIPLTEPSEPYLRRKPGVFKDKPTVANDPHLTPMVKGITDRDSIGDWDAPFALTEKIRSQDDTYWENHRTTPKAYISLAAGQKLWGSRWGNVTSIRVPESKVNGGKMVSFSRRDHMRQLYLGLQILEEGLEDELKAKNITLGMTFQPIKRRDLAASAGTTPFDGLFLGLSFFIMAAALLLVMLLFRLGVEQRGAELGVLMSVGWNRAQILRFLLTEALFVAIPGAVCGSLLGVGYAWLMLVGLRTWWLGAVATPFLELYITPLSFIIGTVTGVLVSLLSIAWTLLSLRHIPIRQLLAGSLSSLLATSGPRHNSRNKIIAGTLLLLAGGLAFLAPRLGGSEAQAGAFLGAGTAVLIALLMLLFEQLKWGGTSVGIIGSFSLGRLALRSAARNPARSLLTLALVAGAGFLIVALSAFRLDPTTRGSGGFPLVATATQPFLADLNLPVEQNELLAEDAMILQAGRVLPFLLQAGDDASCRNLYQPAQPRVLGVSATMVEHYDLPHALPFEWAGSAAKTKEQQANPWRLLTQQTIQDEAVPVVIDKNTAMFSLRLYGGIGQEFEIEYPTRKIRFRVVGLLANSVLQGSLLIGEANFKCLFPETSGYRYFLIQPNPKIELPTASMALEHRLSDQGFEVRESRDVLNELLAVQNTYISTFQTLGALGLLLGTFGVAVVQLRSVLERRGELGLLRAIGFPQRRLALLVMLENIVLLLGGLAIGIIAALIAVLPHMLAGGAKAPLGNLALMLGVVLVVGCVVGLMTVRQVLRLPLIASLRGE